MISVCCKTTGVVGTSTVLARDFKMSNHQLQTIKVDYYNGILEQKKGIR